MMRSLKIRTARRACAWCAGAALLAAPIGQAEAAGISVRVEPAVQSVNVFETFDVTIVADISEPLLGFGFELTFDDQLFALDHTTTNPDFAAVVKTGAEFMSALAFPLPISGPEVLLGSATFTALDAGTGALGIAVAASSLTQGFAEVAIGAMADFDVVKGLVTVASPAGGGGGGGGGPSVPEPGMLALLGLGSLMIARRRR